MKRFDDDNYDNGELKKLLN